MKQVKKLEKENEQQDPSFLGEESMIISSMQSSKEIRVDEERPDEDDSLDEFLRNYSSSSDAEDEVEEVDEHEEVVVVQVEEEEIKVEEDEVEVDDEEDEDDDEHSLSCVSLSDEQDASPSSRNKKNTLRISHDVALRLVGKALDECYKTGTWTDPEGRRQGVHQRFKPIRILYVRLTLMYKYMIHLS